MSKSPTLARLESLKSGTYAPNIRARHHLPADACPVIELVVPVRIVSEANTRGHWRVKANRVAQQRAATRFALEAHVGPTCPMSVPLLVTLTRMSPRELDDDNLATGCKAVRDEIAKWLGVDDRKRDVVRYAYDQESTGMVGLRVRIERMPR